MNESHKQWKKPNKKEYTLYDSIYIKLKNMQNQYIMVVEIRTVVAFGE